MEAALYVSRHKKSYLQGNLSFREGLIFLVLDVAHGQSYMLAVPGMLQRGKGLACR